MDSELRTLQRGLQIIPELIENEVERAWDELQGLRERFDDLRSLDPTMPEAGEIGETLDDLEAQVLSELFNDARRELKRKKRWFENAILRESYDKAAEFLDSLIESLEFHQPTFRITGEQGAALQEKYERFIDDAVERLQSTEGTPLSTGSAVLSSAQVGSHGAEAQVEDPIPASSSELYDPARFRLGQLGCILNRVERSSDAEIGALVERALTEWSGFVEAYGAKVDRGHAAVERVIARLSMLGLSPAELLEGYPAFATAPEPAPAPQRQLQPPELVQKVETAPVALATAPEMPESAMRSARRAAHVEEPEQVEQVEQVEQLGEPPMEAAEVEADAHVAEADDEVAAVEMEPEAAPAEEPAEELEEPVEAEPVEAHEEDEAVAEDEANEVAEIDEVDEAPPEPEAVDEALEDDADDADDAPVEPEEDVEFGAELEAEPEPEPEGIEMDEDDFDDDFDDAFDALQAPRAGSGEQNLEESSHGRILFSRSLSDASDNDGDFVAGEPLYGHVTLPASIGALTGDLGLQTSLCLRLYIDGEMVVTHTFFPELEELEQTSIVLDILPDPEEKGLQWNIYFAEELADHANGDHKFRVEFDSQSNMNEGVPFATGDFELIYRDDGESLSEMAEAVRQAKRAWRRSQQD